MTDKDESKYTGSVPCAYKGFMRDVAKEACQWHLERRDPECLSMEDCSFKKTWPDGYKKIMSDSTTIDEH